MIKLFEFFRLILGPLFQKAKDFPIACKDTSGALRVGAAVGVFDYERAASLIDKQVDFLVVDSAHGHSSNVIETVKEIKKNWDIDVVAGNIATQEGCRDLIAAGADPNTVDGRLGCSALHMASVLGYADISEALIAAGKMQKPGSKAIAAAKKNGWRSCRCSC